MWARELDKWPLVARWQGRPDLDMEQALDQGGALMITLKTSLRLQGRRFWATLSM